MFVKEIMSNKIVTVDGSETIFNACEKYRKYKVGCLIVTDNDNIAGIVTERDFIERTICMHRDPETTMIKEIMSPDIKTIHALDTIEKALDMFKQHNIKKLPVISNDKLVGIVTLTDIAYTRPGIRNFVESWKS